MRVLKTIIIMLALAMLCACGKIPETAEPGNVSGTKNNEPAETVESDEEPEDIKTYCKFYDIVADNDTAQWDRFALIDLDGDGIFELFATCIDGEREDPGIQPYMIVGHNDEDVIRNDELFDGVAGAGGYRGALYYLEGKGKLHESMIFAPMGEPADRVYQLKDGKINDTDVGEFTADRTIDMYADDRDMFEHGEWRWNGKTVTEDEYKNALREATDNTHGKPLCETDWMSTDAVLSKLQNLIDGVE